MGVCEGCTVDFPALDKSHCGRCTKLLAAPQPVTQDVRRGIVVSYYILLWEAADKFLFLQEQPQCECCGCVYLFLQEKVCGSCSRAATTCDGKDYWLCADLSTNYLWTDKDARKAFVEARVADFSQLASTHRLHQVQSRAQNASLKSAAEHRMKSAALRKTAKAEMVTVCTTLWSLPRKGAASKKVCETVLIHLLVH